ncbi:hypothetical protein ACOME3_005652 [Neoechinorhynchus agilis]
MNISALYGIMSTPQWIHKASSWHRSIRFPKRTDEDIKIRYISDNLVVSEKQEGVVVQSVMDQSHTSLLISKLHRSYGQMKLFPVHRLDQCTSGLVCYALNVETAREVGHLMERRSMAIQKEYTALVFGHVQQASKQEWNSIYQKLGRKNPFSCFVDAIEDGKDSMTMAKILERGYYEGERATKLVLQIANLRILTFFDVLSRTKRNISPIVVNLGK